MVKFTSGAIPSFTYRLKVSGLFVDEEGSVVTLSIHDTSCVYLMFHKGSLQAVAAILRTDINSTLG